MSASWDSLVLPDTKIEHTFSLEKRSAIVFEDLPEDNEGSSTKKRSRSCDELPPILVKDPNDRKAVRRARNTEAARRSRAKKNERIDQLEQLVAELRAENAALNSEIYVLKKMDEFNNGIAS